MLSVQLLVDSSAAAGTTSSSVSYLTGLTMVTSLDDSRHAITNTALASDNSFSSSHSASSAIPSASSASDGALSAQCNFKLKWFFASLVVCSLAVGTL